MTLNNFRDEPITVRSVNFWRGDNGRQAIRLLTDLFPGEQFVRWDETGVPDILVSSVFGSLSVPARASAGVKLLYSAENLARFSEYADAPRVNRIFDLTFGFTGELGGLSMSNWLIADQRSPTELEKLCDSLSSPVESRARKFCCLIARSNLGNTRSGIYQSISEIERVACPGQLFRNEAPLAAGYPEKIDYLRDFFFTICPENSLAPGYTTEKLFHAVEAGCIPIYWGDQPSEPAILNNDRIIRFDPQDPQECADRVRAIWNDKQKLAQLISQPGMVPGAGLAVRGYFDRLRTAIKGTLTDRQ